MAESSLHCSVCGTAFVPQFAYQLEAGSDPTRPIAFCSLECVGESLESKGRARCDVCGEPFVVKFAAQVLNQGGRRRHACSSACRSELLRCRQGTNLSAFAVEGRVDRDTTPAPTQTVTLPAPPPQARQTLVPPAPPPSTASGDGLNGPPPQARQTLVPPAPPPSTASGDGLNGPAQARRTRAEARAPSTDHTPPPTSTTWRRIESGILGQNRAIAVFNHKGGTGKTTTSVTLAAGLAARGKRVLLIDTDSQGNVAVSLGLNPERSLYHVLVMGLEPRAALLAARPNLDVLPSNETLAAAELYLAGRPHRDRVLRSRLEGLMSDYDYVVVDCSPSLSLMNQNALVLADALLCPVGCDYLSLVGVRQVLRTMKQVHRLLSHPIRLFGVLPTLYDARARICAESYETLRQHFGDRCLPPIRAASRVKEAPSQARTLFEYAPDSTAARDYMTVVERLLAESASTDLGSSLSQGVSA